MVNSGMSEWKITNQTLDPRDSRVNERKCDVVEVRNDSRNAAQDWLPPAKNPIRRTSS